VALGLALIGLVLLVRGDLGDERGELFDLEAQGADPRLLMFHVRGRAALVGVAGTVAGLVSGAALAGLVVSVVTVTSGGTTGLPPLDLVLDWRGLAVTLALFAAAAGALVALSTRRAFAAPVPQRPSG
jgi:ABC-type antimicrobial peptide transport system permease subunit